MKLLLEISSMGSGVFPPREENGREIRWVRLAGKDKEGRFAVAKTTGPIADGLVREIGKMLMPGEDVSTRKFIVDLTGEWREGKPREHNGRTIRDRYFHMASFNVLDGPILERERIRRETAEVLKECLSEYEAGDVHKAIRLAVRHMSNISGVPIDFAKLERVPDVLDEMEIGGVMEARAQTTEEDIAAAKFEAMDRGAGVVAPAVKIEEAAHVADAVAEEPSQTKSAIVDEPIDEPTKPSEKRTHEADVLDDPTPTDAMVQPEREPEAPKPAPAVRPLGMVGLKKIGAIGGIGMRR